MDVNGKKLLVWASIGGLPLFLIILTLFIAVFAVLGLFDSNNFGSGEIVDGTTCSYNIDGKNVSNVKVKLLECGGHTAISGEELVDFETYITGVVYAESGGKPVEALKTQAVAARSYVLTRPKTMNGAAGLSLEEVNGEWILSIRNCTSDQVFCHPDKGCWSNSSTAGDTVHSGYTDNKAYSKKALGENDNVRVAVRETAGEVLVDKNDKIINTGYVASVQNHWGDLAKQGKDYFEILMDSYGKKGAKKIATPNCETIDTNIDNVEINTLINLSQSEAWGLLIGKKTNENAPYVSQSTMDKRVTTIKVPYRAWKPGKGSNPRTDTLKRYANITVNKALADLWLAFFTDVYNEAPDFVIEQWSGCYVYRAVTGGGNLSAHAYGAACDINAGTYGNGYKQKSFSKSEWQKLPETRSKYQVVYKGSKIMEIAHKYTLINGSDWSSPNDAMHFSFIKDWTRSRAQACKGKVTC